MIISKSPMSGRNGTSWRTFVASLVIASVATVGVPAIAADYTIGASAGATHASLEVLRSDSGVTLGDGDSLTLDSTVTEDKTLTQSLLMFDGGTLKLDSINTVTIGPNTATQFLMFGDVGGLTVSDANSDITITGFVNTADTNGYVLGAIFAIDILDSDLLDGDFTLTNAGTLILSHNKATGGTDTGTGGAISSTGKIDINNTGTLTFSGNEAMGTVGGFGGALAAVENITIANANNTMSFTGNTATTNGGAIFSQSGYISLTSGAGDVTFDGNKAGTTGVTASGGGAIYAGQVTLTESGSGNITFTNNIAGEFGGAMLIHNTYTDPTTPPTSIVNINGATFGGSGTGNEAGKRGGAIYIVNTATIAANNIIKNSLFEGNKVTAGIDATDGGGAIYTKSALTIIDTNFKDNTVTGTGNGGAIYTEKALVIKAETANVTFSGNKVIDSTGNEVANDIHLAGADASATFNAASGLTISLEGGISGTGAVVKTGAGTLTFASSSGSTYTGTTDIQAGTLEVIGSFGTDDNYAGAITNAGTLKMNRASGNQTLSGVISGGGTLTKTGDGTLILAGANTYTGNTTINAGIVEVGHNNAFGTTGDVILGGAATIQKVATVAAINIGNDIGLEGKALTVNNTDTSDALTLSGVVSGTGSLTKTGSGKLILSGTNNITSFATTVSAGTLSVTTAANVGTGTFTLENNAILDVTGTSFNKAIALGASGGTINTNTVGVTSSAVITGSTALTKTGVNNLTLTGKTDDYSGTINIQEGTLTIGTGGSLSVMAEQTQSNASISVASGATFAIADTGKLVVTVDDLANLTSGTFYFANVATGGSISATISNLDLSSISEFLYKTNYADNTAFITVARKSADDIKYVSREVAQSLAGYTPGNNAFLDKVIEKSTGNDYIDAERFELGYNAAAAVGVGFQAASAGDLFRRSLQQQLAGRTICASFGRNHRRQPGQTLWVAPTYGHQQANKLQSGDVKYGYSSEQYSAAFGIEGGQGRIKFGVAAQLGGGNISSRQTALVRTKSDSFFGGVGLYSTMPAGHVDVVSQLGWVGMGGKLKQSNGAAQLSADVSGGLVFYSLGFEKTFRSGQICVTPLLGLEYGYVYQNAFETKDKTFKADGGGAHIVTLPVGVRVWRDYNNLRPGGFGCFTPEVSARFLPNVGDTELPYTTTPTGATAAKLRSLVSDDVAGDVAFGLNWRGRATEVGVRYGVLFSERFTNQDASLMIRRTF